MNGAVTLFDGGEQKGEANRRASSHEPAGHHRRASDPCPGRECLAWPAHSCCSGNEPKNSSWCSAKPLYGHQEGAEVGYNPHKPGRPSHVLHTFWIGKLRLVLDAVLTSGKQHSSGHAKAPLKRLLDELGEHKPAARRNSQDVPTLTSRSATNAPG